MFVKRPASLATFSAAKMGKATLAHGESLFAGLNSFEPGQQHALHAHEAQEKLYIVLEGSALVQIADQTEELKAGDLAFAAAGVPHAITNPGPGRLVVMAVLAPPPRAERS